MTLEEPQPSRRARARPGEGERLKEEIIDAAERLLVEVGDQDRVSVRAIADAVGCTPPAIYLHFTDKDHLFLEMCERRVADLHRVLEDAAAEARDDPVEVLRAQGRAYVGWALEHEHHYRSVMMSRLHLTKARPLEELEGMKAMRRLVETVSRCMETGAFKPADPFKVAVGLWTALHGLVAALLTIEEFPFPPPDDMATHIIDTQIAGLRA
jgi:AcrR family transcriptional regulator